MWSRFSQPRRLILSTLAAALAVVWLGNAALTVWLRESGSVETLRALLSLGLVVYAGWHLAKAAFFRPESPFDWTTAEREILTAMPFRSRDLVGYQLASVSVTTLLKAGLFTLLLLPDLSCVPLGFVGLLLAMLLLEMLRMAIDIATWGMGRKAFLTYRGIVVAGLLGAGLAIGVVIAREDAFNGRIGFEQDVRQRLLDTLVRLNDSAFGYLALPFRPFVDLILAERVTPAQVGLAVMALGMVLSLAVAVVMLYTRAVRNLDRREKRKYATDGWLNSFSERPLMSSAGSAGNGASRVRLWHLPRWGGVSALAWRQLLGARRHWGSLLTAMIAPAVLAGAPVFLFADPNFALLATTGTLAFYTFLLLPTALRFDFRRDLDRLATLKGLPIRPSTAVIGQTLAPVLLATLFQAGVLAFAIVARSLPLHLLPMTLLVMIPMNALVFGLDNLIYLLYPYRLQQEGLEVFLRTMLTFTGKGLLFAGSLAAMSTWGFASAAITRGIAPWTGSAVTAIGVFVCGLVIGLSLLATLVLYVLSRTYRNMNPVEDMPH